MADFVTLLHATFGRKLAKLCWTVEDAFLNENANEKHQLTPPPPPVNGVRLRPRSSAGKLILQFGRYISTYLLEL